VIWYNRKDEEKGRDARRVWSLAGPGLEWIYFFCSMEALQHLSAPVPPLVTITWEPHLPQM